MIARRELLSALGGAALLQGQRRAPNFVVLFADDFGYGDLGCYGHPTIRTPNLDRMASEGMRFTSFYAAASVCTPSRVGLLTGRYPMRAGQPDNTGPDTVGGLPLKEMTLAQLLKTRGYKTAAIGKWHLGFQPKEYLPTSRGFDRYFGLPYSNDMRPPWVKTETPLFLYRNEEKIEVMRDQSTLTERYTDEAKRFIKDSGDDPFFLYMPYAMPHLPISASSKKGASRAGLYGDVVETLDWSAGEVMKALREAGVERDTLIVFTSDNGPWQNLPPRMFAEGVEPWHVGTKSLLRGSKGDSFEGGFRVPGIFRWPGVIPAGQVSAEMAATLDLFPTIAKAAGAALPSDRTYDGYDLLPMLRAGGESPRKSFLYFRGKTLEAVREGSWKLRSGPAPRLDGAIGKEVLNELFHLDRDPAEMYNLYDREPEVRERLWSVMRAAARELNAPLARVG